MLPFEKEWFNPKPGLYSVRLVNSKDCGSFGTNGKGRSPLYALASAYAEFIERLQNGFVVGADGLNRMFLKEIYRDSGFFYYPDEKILNKADFFSLPNEYLKDISNNSSKDNFERVIDLYFGRLKQNGLGGVVSVPFYDCSQKKIVYLPYNLTLTLSGSNGMAAGNSPEESIFQALCELVERYSARTVFFERITPPTIPDSVLSRYSDEYEIISKLRESGYDVVVKDFSCGKKLPAVGVILLDKHRKKYRLNIGAETSFKFALSRCLTEIFQGIGDDSVMEKFMLDVPSEYPDYFRDESDISHRRKECEIRQFIINGTGVFPPSLFQSDSSYSFDLNTYQTHESYGAEVKYLIDLFSSLGHSVYIRNTSFLGFPSFYVYIPEVSVWGRKTNQDTPTIHAMENSLVHDQIEDVFFPASSLLDDDRRLRKLLDLIAPNGEHRYPNISIARVLKVDVLDCDLARMPTSFFVSLLCFANKEYVLAQVFLEHFLREFGLEKEAYYKKVIRFFKDNAAGRTKEELTKKYGSDFISGFSSKDRLFSSVGFPKCPNCGDCLLSAHCSTKSNYKNAMIIARKMRENNSFVNQKIVESILD